MNKMREYERGREDGLLLAQKIVKQDGIEALDREVKFRGCTGIHTSLACKDLDKAAEQIKEMTLDIFVVIGVAALYDLYGFGEKRCQRWIDKINEAAEYIVNDMAKWEDYTNAIKEQIGLTLDMRWQKER